MASYWHILKSTARFSEDCVQAIWDEEREGGFVSAGYGNEPQGRGRAKLCKYEDGDLVFIYVPGRGGLAVAEVNSDAPHYVDQPHTDDHAHRRNVRWLRGFHRINDAVPIDRLRRLGAPLPRTLGVRLSHETSVKIAELLPVMEG